MDICLDELKQVRREHAKFLNKGKLTTGSGLASYAKGRDRSEWTEKEIEERDK